MYTVRSPTGSDPGAERSGSVPELTSTKYNELADAPRITFRQKRKQNDENDQIKCELGEIRKQMSEMMIYLKSVNNTHTENLNKLREDVASIKNDARNIRAAVDTLTTEQNKLKSEVAGLVDFARQTEMRMDALESNLQQLHATNLTATTTTPLPCEDIITEIKERSQRAKNIIVAGLAERNEIGEAEKTEADQTEVINIIEKIYPECPEPIKIFRLGKRNQGKSRLVKVCFETQETAISILRKKHTLKSESIKIFGDQTPYQKDFLKSLKDKLASQTANGEKDLIIKYIKGVPKIITQQILPEPIKKKHLTGQHTK